MLVVFFKSEFEDIVNIQYDIAINSCGRYEFVKQKEFKTYRPGGRDDFTLLYIAKGTVTFPDIMRLNF